MVVVVVLVLVSVVVLELVAIVLMVEVVLLVPVVPVKSGSSPCASGPSASGNYNRWKQYCC